MAGYNAPGAFLKLAYSDEIFAPSRVSVKEATDGGTSVTHCTSSPPERCANQREKPLNWKVFLE